MEVTSSFQIRDIIVFPTRNRVLVHNTEYQMEPIAMSVLVCLSESAGQVVSRQELLESVWPDVVVDDTSLSKAVCNVRKVLQYSDTDQRFIETVPKVGYRLIPDVRFPEVRFPADPLARTRIYLVAVSCVCLLLIGYIAYSHANPITQFEEVIKVRHPDGSIDSLSIVSESPIVLNTSFFDVDNSNPRAEMAHDAESPVD